MKKLFKALSVAAGLGIALAVTLTPAEAGEWKWVDGGGDCVSTCNASEYNCPCYKFI